MTSTQQGLTLYHGGKTSTQQGLTLYHGGKTSTQQGLTLQCGKPFFSNTRQNGEWTETITRQDEKELAMFGE